MSEELRQKVEAVLDRIRPALMMDGGNVELVDVSEGVVTLRLLGACHGCPSATMTLQYGIEQALKEQIPEVERVVAV
jgi:Fe-S cluster biogenesis protein NfuA